MDEPVDDRTSLGQAVRDAKQRYLAGTLVLTPYDEKILQSWTYYGLPMYTLGDIVEDGTTSEGNPTFAPLAGATALGEASALVAGPVSYTHLTLPTTPYV